MKTYTYNPQRYFLAVIAPIILMSVIIIWAINGLLSEQSNSLHMISVIVVPIILLSSVFGANKPKDIVISNKGLEFKGFGRVHIYDYEDIYSVKIKEYMFIDKVYIRINNGKLLRGRYWVDLFQFNDYEELREKFRELEIEYHPEREKYQKKKVNYKKLSEKRK